MLALCFTIYADDPISIETIGQIQLETNTDELTTNEITTLTTSLDSLNDTLSNKEIGLVASRWLPDGRLLYRLRYNDNEVYAIASAFKAFVAYYVLYNTPPDEWQTHPDSDLYNMVVYSDNSRTARLLLDMMEQRGLSNAIIAFNDFMLEHFGLSPQSGLYAWDYGDLDSLNMIDERYRPRSGAPDGMVEAHGALFGVNNRYTAGDAALALERIAHLPLDPSATEREQAAADLTLHLMAEKSVLHPTFFDRTAHDLGTSRKYGFIGADILGAVALSELIVVPLVDGGHLQISILAFDERGSSLPVELGRIFTTLMRFDHPRTVGLLSPPNFSMIPTADPQPEQINYGFVIPHQLQIFSEPDSAAELIPHNFRADIPYPMTYIHSGALLPFDFIDSDWGKIRWNTRAEPFNGLGAFIQISDLHIVDHGYFAPIAPLTPSDPPPTKFMIADMRDSTLALLEDDVVILKTPILANNRLTGNGGYRIGQRTMSQSRSHFPFVPFIAAFTNDGQALQSASWEWWDLTIRAGYQTQRYTDGNIHVPDWIIDVPNFGAIRADVFVWRWLGGLDDPANTLQQGNVSQADIVRLYGIRYGLEDLSGWSPPGRLRLEGVRWRDLMPIIESAPLTTPASYRG